MTPHMKYSIAGIIIGLILLAIIPTWAALVIVAAAIAIPAGAYLMLDPAQRRKVRETRRRQLRG